MRPDTWTNRTGREEEITSTARMTKHRMMYQHKSDGIPAREVHTLRKLRLLDSVKEVSTGP